MKYCIMIYGKRLTFWLKNCKKCNDTLVVHTSRGAVRCVDCMRKQYKIDGRKPTHTDHVFIRISGKSLLRNYRAGLYEKVSVVKNRKRVIRTCDNYYEP